MIEKQIKWHPVAQLDELQNGQQKAVMIDDISILIIRLNENIYAIHNLCTHLDKPLAGGRIIGEELMCPFHAGKFCLKTGKALSGPVTEGVQSYDVKIIDNEVLVHIP